MVATNKNMITIAVITLVIMAASKRGLIPFGGSGTALQKDGSTPA